MKQPRRRSLVALSLTLCLGCAARVAQRPPAPPASPAPARTSAPAPNDSEERDGLSISGGLGQVDEAEVEQLFRGRLSDINRCFQQSLEQKWFLGGRLELKLRVGEDGGVRSAAVVQSTLGSFEVERCVQGVARALRFQRPKGGEAELTYPVDFPARAAVRSWPGERVASNMARHRGEVGQCQERAKARVKRGTAGLRVTVYIGPGGRVASAGLAADEPIDERVGSCLITRVLAWRFEDPLGQLTKATYAFD